MSDRRSYWLPPPLPLLLVLSWLSVKKFVYIYRCNKYVYKKHKSSNNKTGDEADSSVFAGCIYKIYTYVCQVVYLYAVGPVAAAAAASVADCCHVILSRFISTHTPPTHAEGKCHIYAYIALTPEKETPKDSTICCTAKNYAYKGHSAAVLRIKLMQEYFLLNKFI